MLLGATAGPFTMQSLGVENLKPKRTPLVFVLQVSHFRMHSLRLCPVKKNH